MEFSPYGRDSQTFTPSASLQRAARPDPRDRRQRRRFDALGPRTQQDVAEVLRWACSQSWSNGTLGLNGFSASAITIYNSLHLPLPCVKAAVLKSGTHELYRDLIYPGGVSNLVPGARRDGADRRARARADPGAACSARRPDRQRGP